MSFGKKGAAPAARLDRIKAGPADASAIVVKPNDSRDRMAAKMAAEAEAEAADAVYTTYAIKGALGLMLVGCLFTLPSLFGK